jgi:two-component system, NtrC family, nitrogen regulation response regulator NtrX
LRVIQEQKIERIGGEKTIETDVRIIAATNQDLEKACNEGRFRQDLFFRLNVIPIHVQPLRERLEDIPILLMHFLKVLNREITPEASALDILAAHDWPGNVRELKNLAERISVMHSADVITGAEIQKLMDKKIKNHQNTGNILSESIFELNFNDAKESFEKCYLEFQLLKNNGIISKTAEAIGIYPSNLHTKLRKHNITTTQHIRL